MGVEHVSSVLQRIMGKPKQMVEYEAPDLDGEERERIVKGYISLLSKEQVIELGKYFIERDREENMPFDEMLVEEMLLKGEMSGVSGLENPIISSYTQLVSQVVLPNLERILEKKVKTDKIPSDVARFLHHYNVLSEISDYIERNQDEIRKQINKGYRSGKDGVKVFTEIMYNIYKEIIKMADEPKKYRI